MKFLALWLLLVLNSDQPIARTDMLPTRERHARISRLARKIGRYS